jgi:hypothetical protein
VIKLDEGEMSQILKEAFRLKGEEIGRACNVPTVLKPLVTGATAIVSISLSKGNTLLLSEGVMDESCEKKLRACRKKVKEQKIQIEKLQAEQETVTITEETNLVGDTVIYQLDKSTITES